MVLELLLCHCLEVTITVATAQQHKLSAPLTRPAKKGTEQRQTEVGAAVCVVLICNSELTATVYMPIYGDKYQGLTRVGTCDYPQLCSLYARPALSPPPPRVVAPVECCLEKVHALLRHQPRDYVRPAPSHQSNSSPPPSPNCPPPTHPPARAHAVAPVECCLDKVYALLWHQPRDDSNDGLVRVLL